MSHECLHKRPGGQVGLLLETHCKKKANNKLKGIWELQVGMRVPGVFTWGSIYWGPWIYMPRRPAGGHSVCQKGWIFQSSFGGPAPHSPPFLQSCACLPDRAARRHCAQGRTIPSSCICKWEGPAPPEPQRALACLTCRSSNHPVFADAGGPMHNLAAFKPCLLASSHLQMGKSCAASNPLFF